MLLSMPKSTQQTDVLFSVRKHSFLLKFEFRMQTIINSAFKWPYTLKRGEQLRIFAEELIHSIAEISHTASLQSHL